MRSKTFFGCDVIEMKVRRRSLFAIADQFLDTIGSKDLRWPLGRRGCTTNNRLIRRCLELFISTRIRIITVIIVKPKTIFIIISATGRTSRRLRRRCGVRLSLNGFTRSSCTWCFYEREGFRRETMSSKLPVVAARTSLQSCSQCVRWLAPKACSM